VTLAPPPLDLSDPAVVADPYPTFARARAEAPVQWDEQLGMWLAFTHTEANAVLRDRRLGRIWRDRAPAERFDQFNLIHRNAILEMEPPTHTRLRRLVSAAFGRGHVERLRPWVADLADELVELLASGGDLLATLAAPLPVAVIAELLGVPAADRPLLVPWSNAIVKMYEYNLPEPQRVAAEQAAAEFVAYLRDLSATPAAGSLISDLVTVRDSDDRLNQDELVATAVLLLMAGHEATVNVIGNGVLALLRNRDQWQRLVDDPSLVPTAVEEMIRYDAPLQLFERTATADVTIAGFSLRAGEKIAALLGAAARDPEVFDRPDVFDVGRDPNPHLGFGAGIHYCVGAPLARVEITAALTALVRRMPALELAGEPERRPEFVIRGLRTLAVS
jgi:cytochrome P450